MAKITRAAIDAMKAPTSGLAYLWDSSLPGFGVRITSAGVTAYVLRYRFQGRQRIKTLGRTSVLELSEARAAAQSRLAALYSGTDPFAGHGEITSLRDLAEAFQRGRKDELKPKTLAGYRSLWDAHILPAIGTRPHDGLVEEDIATLRKRLAKKKTTFNRCVELILAALRWHGVPVDGHPFQRTSKFKEAGRERILAEEESARLYAAFADYKAQRKAGWRYVDLFALLLLTALRRDEWRKGRWEWIRWDEGLYILPDNKTGGRTVYLPALAVDILRGLWQAQRRPASGYIFPSPSTKRKPISWTWRTWDAMRTDLNLQGFTIHDMRRTAGSYAHRLGGLNQRQVADLLGHKRLETSSRYIHDAEKRHTADAAAEAIAGTWQKSNI